MRKGTQNFANIHCRDWKIKRFIVGIDFFLPLPKGYSHVLEAKNFTLGSAVGLKDFKFIYICELLTCTPILSMRRLVEGCDRNYLMDRGVLKLQFKDQWMEVQLLHKDLLNSKSVQ